MKTLEEINLDLNCLSQILTEKLNNDIKDFSPLDYATILVEKYVITYPVYPNNFTVIWRNKRYEIILKHYDKEKC